MNTIKAGIIGCGNISRKYLQNLTEVFINIEVLAVTDIAEELARIRAEEFMVPIVCRDGRELVSMPEIDMVIVLTNPGQHFSVCEMALTAGKHTYVEKPISLCTEEAKKLLELAGEKGVMLSSAPDTILGSGMQMARKLIDDGWIGKPFAAISHILTGGPESWHPNPAFLYHKGAGPLFDVAPYYIAGLTFLLGPVESVMCSAKITYPERTITSQTLYGSKIQVEVPTYLTGILNMKNGGVATIHHSFDVNDTRLDDSIEIYGTEGTLIIPTPCGFSGDILYKKKFMKNWAVIPCIFKYRNDMRGVGAADMASAVLEGRTQRITPEFAYHTLDVLESLSLSAEYNESKKVESTFIPLQPMEINPEWGDEDKL